MELVKLLDLLQDLGVRLPALASVLLLLAGRLLWPCVCLEWPLSGRLLTADEPLPRDSMA